MRAVFRILHTFVLPSALSIPCRSQVPQPSTTSSPEMISMCEDSECLSKGSAEQIRQ